MPDHPTRSRRRTGGAVVRGLVLALVAVLALGACADDPDGTDDPATGGTAAATTAATTTTSTERTEPRERATVPASVPHDESTAPREFLDRAPLPSCGVEEVRPPHVAWSPTGPACLRDAVGSAEGAELVAVSSTVEGDALVTYFRATPGGGVVVFHDTTRDKFGPRTWSRERCDDVRVAQRNGTQRLEVTGCGKVRTLG